jgi:hypothetical protein
MGQPVQQVDYTLILNEMANRLRVLESRQATFSEKLLVINQNMLEEYKKVMKDMKATREEIEGVKDEIGKVKNVVKHFSDEASRFARQDDVKVLQKYVEFWNPMKFVTEQEIEHLVARAMGKRVKYEVIETTEEKGGELGSTSIEDVLSLLKKDKDAAGDTS